jgi:hypothetical protein
MYKTRFIPQETMYKTRFIPQDLASELINLYHLAKTALSGQDDSRHSRMIWSSNEFSKKHGISKGGVYKDLCGLLE